MTRSLATKIFSQLHEKKSSYWNSNLNQKALTLFHNTAKNVPAYKDFLKRNGITASKIKTWADFQSVPPISKKNYLVQYPLSDLCHKGALCKNLVFTSTSGSTGEPFYFPRGRELDWQYSLILEQFLHQAIKEQGSTLVIVCFGMGVWIGGLITYHAFELVNERGAFPVSIITPGVNKGEIFAALKNIAPLFDNVVLCGYPPFIKDLIDEAEDNGISWKDHNVKFIFAAESFTVAFGDYIVKKTGIKNLYTDTMNIYGSADLGAMAHETPLSIFIRRVALQNKRIYQSILADANRTPTLAQFNPLFIQFEGVDKKIYCTGNNALPLVRYEIGDHGGVVSFDTMIQRFADCGVDLLGEAAKAGIKASMIYSLPFVYVYERVDLSTKLYGAIIYPEYIKEALQHEQFEEFITGKFTMFTNFTEEQNEYLEINIELRATAKESDTLKERATKTISENLIFRSAEHKNNSQMMAEKVEPRIIFWDHGHPLHFKEGVKQKWTKK